MKTFFLTLLTSLLFVMASQGQSLQRIEADFSLKESDKLGNKKLSVGKVYYDKNIRVVVFKITFPYEEVLCIHDEGITRYKADTVYSNVIALGLIDFNIFNLFLNGNLDYYGLKQSPFDLKDVEQDNQKIISTWVNKRNKDSGIGKIMLSQEDKAITGLITFNVNDEIVSKQFFEEYIDVSGFKFPSQVIQYLISGPEKEVRISNYREVKINQYDQRSPYDYHAQHSRSK